MQLARDAAVVHAQQRGGPSVGVRLVRPRAPPRDPLEPPSDARAHAEARQRRQTSRGAPAARRPVLALDVHAASGGGGVCADDTRAVARLAAGGFTAARFAERGPPPVSLGTTPTAQHRRHRHAPCRDDAGALVAGAPMAQAEQLLPPRVGGRPPEAHLVRHPPAEVVVHGRPPKVRAQLPGQQPHRAAGRPGGGRARIGCCSRRGQYGELGKRTRAAIEGQADAASLEPQLARALLEAQRTRCVAATRSHSRTVRDG
eukprot:5215203-Prymnesium_polylepis.5